MLDLMNWRRGLLAAAFVSMAGLLMACEESAVEEAGDAVEDTAEEAGDAVGDAAEETGEAIEGAAEEVEEEAEQQ